MPNFTDEVIDLTTSDYYTPPPRNVPCIINCDDVIDLADDSFDGEIINNCTKKTKANRKNNSKRTDVTNETNEKANEQSLGRFGHCPICFEELGVKPLASTKCGHVYCLPCLQSSLKHSKQCPTCRQVLRGAAAYHPLYLVVR